MSEVNQTNNERVILGLRIVAASMAGHSLRVGDSFREVSDIAKDALAEISRLRSGLKRIADTEPNDDDSWAVRIAQETLGN